MPALLESLRDTRAAGHEVIVVDGGSEDGGFEAAAPLVNRVLRTPPGRARQMNAGAAAASGEVLWFVHADSQVPAGAVDSIVEAMLRGHSWGRFKARLSGAHVMFRVIERLMNWRSCLTSIATGDQAIWVCRECFGRAGGFPNIPLMEDIALSRALKRERRAACLADTVITSSRRWERHGIFRTLLLMWSLRAGYFLGADPAWLARRYYGK